MLLAPPVAACAPLAELKGTALRSSNWLPKLFLHGPLDRSCQHDTDLLLQSRFITAPTRSAVLPGTRLAQPFSTSPAHLKKRKPEQTSKSAPAAQSSGKGKGKDTSAASNAAEEFDPLDLAPIETALAEAGTHAQSEVQNILHGGRFNPNQLGALSVSVKPEGGGAGEADSFPLRELAQVVPRSGRTVSLLVNDKAYVKPIMSAVQASPDFNQQPQRAEDNDLELLLRVEMERPEELARRIKEATQGWRDRVRQARAKHDKVLKDVKKKGGLLPDAARKLDKELQKLQDKKMKEIDDFEAQSIKQTSRN